MIKTIFSLRKVMVIAICLATSTFGVYAQDEKESYLKLSHYPTASSTIVTVDEFSLTGAEVLIKGNEVSVEYAAQPAKNRKFDFDLITSFEFGLRTITGINNVNDTVFRAYIDGAKILHVEAEESLGQVNIYALTGSLLTSHKTDGNRAQINMSEFQRGIYILQGGVNRVMIVKN